MTSYVHVIYEDVHYAIPEKWAIDEHPGGADDILCVRGKDMTDDFDAIGHSRDALNILKSFDNIPITNYNGDEYHVNVHWLAATKKEDGDATTLLDAFLAAVAKSEADVHAVMDSWPDALKAHARKHFRIPSVGQKTNTNNVDVPPTPPCTPVVVPAPAAAAPPAMEMAESSPSSVEKAVPSPSAAAASSQPKSTTPSAAATNTNTSTATGGAGCPCTNPKFILGLAAVIGITYAINKYRRQN